MSQELLQGLSEANVAAHMRSCFDSPSGQIVWEVLRKLCFMEPTATPQPVESTAQASSRIGLTNLFRKLEYYRTQPPTLKEQDDD